MKKAICYLFGAVLQLSLTSSWAGGMSEPLHLVYSGNLDGELEPCGCSVEGDLGGILRRATTIDRLRSESPNLFLISSGGLLSSVSPQDRLTGEYILRGMAALNYDAIGLQWGDLVYGESFIGTDLPWVASNWQQAQFSAQRQVSHGGYRMTVFSWLEASQSPQAEMPGEHQLVSSDVSQLSTALVAARQRGELSVVTTTLTLPEAQDRLPLEQIDILFIRSAYEVFSEPHMAGETLVLQAGSRGMRLGHLELFLNAAGRIDSWQHEVILMPSAVDDAVHLQSWYDSYNDAVRSSYKKLVAQRKARKAGTSPYGGEEMCQGCHATEHKRWGGTKHSQAYYRLEEVNKAFDPACIVCHTVGFNSEGGFIDMEATPQLLNVQCESCHGAARKHAESQGREPVGNHGWKPQQICAQCHTQPHSPMFNYEEYWPNVLH